jgi:hypothetical protein
MGESVRQLAVVGHQDQSLALIIQPAHRMDGARNINKVAHRPASVAGFRLHGGQDIARFVQRDVDQRLCRRDGLAVHGDLIDRPVRLLTEFRDLPVDPHTAGSDEILAGTARTISCLRKYLL